MEFLRVAKKRKRTELFPVEKVQKALESGRTIVFTDGSGGAISGAGAWFGDQDPRNVSTRVHGEQGSARAELFAIVCALERCLPREAVTVLSDSRDAIRSVLLKTTRLMQRCPDLLKKLCDLELDRDVEYIWIPGHSGIRGNMEADRLAKRARAQPQPTSVLIQK